MVCMDDLGCEYPEEIRDRAVMKFREERRNRRSNTFFVVDE